MKCFALFSTPLLYYFALCVAPAAAADPLYSITQIGTPSTGGTLQSVAPVAINSAGVVAGTAGVPQNFAVFTFSAGNFVLLNIPFTHDTGSIATGFNNPGQLTGIETGAQPTAYGFVYFQGTLTGLPGQFGPAGINDTGQIAGTEPAGGTTRHAALDINGSVSDLGALGGSASAATAINNNGQITGTAALAGDAASHAFVYSGHGLIDIGTLGGTNSAGAAINSTGNVAGTSDVAGNSVSHAFLFNGTVMQDLGSLTGYPNSHARGVNASGKVVGNAEIVQNQQFSGSHAFVYRDGSMVDLNSVIPAGSGWILTYASAINDAGQIVGGGTLNGQPGEGFLLTPSDTPPSCRVAAHAGPPEELVLTVQATGSGLKTVQVVDSSNARVSIPAFSIGATTPVFVNAATSNERRSSSVALQVTDVAAHTISCDAADYIAEVTNRKETHAFRDLSGAEHFIRITNGAPGLTDITFLVNRMPFTLSGLTAGATATLNVQSAMKAGDRNRISVETSGAAGSSAVILVGDSSVQ